MDRAVSFLTNESHIFLNILNHLKNKPTTLVKPQIAGKLSIIAVVFRIYK